MLDNVVLSNTCRYARRLLAVGSSSTNSHPTERQVDSASYVSIVPRTPADGEAPRREAKAVPDWLDYLVLYRAACPDAERPAISGKNSF